MLEIKDIKKGDSFWECESGMCDHYVALEDGYHAEATEDYAAGWFIRGEDDYGNVIVFFVSDNYPHYGPNLYSYQAYY